MKRVVCGVQYNTASASVIGTLAEGEVLYQKRTGEFFKGDAKSITPLSFEEAKAEAKKHDCFNKMIFYGTDKKTDIHIKITDVCLKKAQRMCVLNNTTLGDYIDMLIDLDTAYFDYKGGE